MKKRNKGFILAEVIAVSSVVIVTLIVIYAQFIPVVNGYNASFSYNTINNLYITNNVIGFLKESDISKLAAEADSALKIDITNCSVNYITEYQYCEMLLKNSNIKTLLFTKEDISDLKASIDLQTVKINKFDKFIKSIKTSDESSGYRLIVEFNDETFSSLKFEVGGLS